MPKDLTKENAPTGKIIFEWLVNEFEQHVRTRRWYIVASIIAVALVVYAVVSTNYLFAMVIVLFGIVLYLHAMQEPLQVYFAITETGIILGKKYYRFSELADFWFIYNPPEVKNMYFTLNNILKHRLQVPLMDYDPRPIRDYLNQFLSENVDQEEEPLSDRMARLLKLH